MAIQRPASPTSRTTAPPATSAYSTPSSKAHSLTDPVPVQAEGMSEKQRQLIAIIGLAACLLVGAGIIYWLLFSGPKHRTIAVDPAKQGPGMNRGQVYIPPRPRQAINREGNDWRVQANTSYMIVKGTNNLALHYEPRSFVSSEQSAFVSGAYRSTIDQAMATEWGITADQLAKLKPMFPLGKPVIVVTDAERKEMQDLWNKYSKASDGSAKSDAEKAVIKRLDELAKSHMDESKKVFAAKLDKVKAVLTPEQAEKVSKR